MAIDTVETSLEMSFNELVSKFSKTLNNKSFYELSSVIQANQIRILLGRRSGRGSSLQKVEGFVSELNNAGERKRDSRVLQ
jgi:hypothetical protein